MASKTKTRDGVISNVMNDNVELEMKENGKIEKKQEIEMNLDKKEKETALEFVNSGIDAIIKNFKLHELSSLGNKSVKENMNDTNEENEDWQSNDETYQTVVINNTFLLKKLLQLANDIDTENDSNNKFTKERKISILQNIGFAIWRMNSKINDCSSILEMDEFFLQAIDDSFEMKSKLKNRMDIMDEKSVKNLINIMHQKTKTEGLMQDDEKLSTMAYMMTLCQVKYSLHQIFNCIKIYVAVCHALKLDEQIESSKANDFIESEEFDSECDEILQVGREYFGLTKEEECDDYIYDSNHDNEQNTTAGLTDNDKNDRDESKKRKKKACDGIRFDKKYGFINKRVHYGSDALENVYNGIVEWDALFAEGRAYCGIDCGNNLLSFCGGTGWKYRKPMVSCCYFDNDNDCYGYGCNAGFAEIPDHCYCDDIYNRCWFQGDSRIKGTYIIDKNGNNNKKTKKTNENENERDDNKGFEYILCGWGMMTSTKDAIMALNHKGTLQVWYYDKLLKQNRSYWTLAGGDEYLPEKDEFGIELNLKLRDDAFWDEGEETVEVSRGQSPHLTKEIQIFNKNETIGPITVDGHGIRMSVINNNDDKSVVSYGNTLNMYDLNKECVDNVYLASRFSISLPTRQHLYSKDNCTLVSYDFNCVKIWDTRMGVIAHTSIYGCGKKRIVTALGFSINGHSFIATGGNDEAVTIWDLRKHNYNHSINGALYEMSTGNNIVTELAWHESSLTLYATTYCLYIDRLGFRYYGSSDDREDCDSDGNELDWPERAMHKKGDFKSDYDAGTNAICSYSFLSA